MENWFISIPMLVCWAFIKTFKRSSRDWLGTFVGGLRFSKTLSKIVSPVVFGISG